ncbi:MAG TPA: hypothetical protein VNK24_02025 [Elusimicrobiota bacterium]|nr:hypothetical protein [Elusimicrobiota bacterium]
MDKKAGLAPWLGALAMACALCAGYPLMAVWRGAWQDHYPQIAAQWPNNGRFTMVGWYGTELAYEELGYADRANDQAHHLLAFDPYIRTNRTWRQLSIDRLTYLILGGLDDLTGGVSDAWMLARFLCCAAWFLLIYLIVQRLGDYPPLSFFCAAFVTGFSYILTFLFRDGLVWSGGLAHVLGHNLWTLLSYGRTEGVLRLPRPGLTWAFLFLAGLWLAKAEESRATRWTVLSGVLGGLLAYVRMDVWSSYVIASGVFALVVSLRDKKPAWELWASFALTALVSLPFLAANYPPAPDLLLKSGLLPRRQFHPDSLAYLAAFLLGLCKRKNPTALFCATLAASIFVMVNIELITGYPMSPQHWMFFGNIYVFLLALAFVPEGFKRGARLWRGAAWGLMIVALFQGLSYAAIHYPFQGLPKNYGDALAWLDKNTPKDSEVLTINPEVDALIPAFTRDKVNAAFELAVLSDYPLLKNCERFVAGLKLLGADPKRFFDECLFHAPHYGRRQVVALGLKRGKIEKGDVGTLLFYMTPPESIPGIVVEAEKRPADIHPDYIWFGDMERQYARPDFARAARKDWRAVYRNPSVVIYARTAEAPRP